MNDLDVQEQRLLAGARRALSPNVADQRRVLATLGATLALPPHVSAPTATGAKVLHYLLGVSVLGVAVLAGYGWGYRVGVDRKSVV